MFDVVRGVLEGVLDPALLGVLVGAKLKVGTGVGAMRIGTCVDPGLGDDAMEVAKGDEVLACSVFIGGEGVENLLLIGDEMSYEVSVLQMGKYSHCLF
jgi:hypothetical protein